MKENKKNTTNSSMTESESAVVNQQVLSDVRNSLLITSLFANLVILTLWVAVQVTTAYDAQLVALLGR